MGNGREKNNVNVLEMIVRSKRDISRIIFTRNGDIRDSVSTLRPLQYSLRKICFHSRLREGREMFTKNGLRNDVIKKERRM